MSAKRTAASSRARQAAKQGVVRHIARDDTATSTDLARLARMTDEEIDAQIAADPDVAPELDDDWFARADRVPAKPNKVAISLRVDPDVLQWYKGTSPRYQSRMNEVLRAYMEHQRAQVRASSAPPERRRKPAAKRK